MISQAKLSGGRGELLAAAVIALFTVLMTARFAGASEQPEFRTYVPPPQMGAVVLDDGVEGSGTITVEPASK
ncbi:MAG: hypothetical protein KC912_15075 [Proteobacteria bacterium]|nr:hypothetical protein [Pseudomonadota bacterium]